MHKKIREHFIKDVESLNEGQLLQSTNIRTITGSTTETFTVKVPTGRGDIKGFSVSFTGFPLALGEVFFTLSVNGKEVNSNLPALAYALIQDSSAAGSLGISSGAQRLPKTMFRISEGAIITIKVVAEDALFGGVEMIVDGYFTDKFIPEKMDFNLVQQFRHLAGNGVVSVEDFVLPTARGRIVGISLFTNNQAELVAPDLGANLSINGVRILENFSPTKYLTSNNMMYVNNWIVNIEGGAVMTSIMDNTSVNDIELSYILYFSEWLGSKRHTGIESPTGVARTQPPIT